MRDQLFFVDKKNIAYTYSDLLRSIRSRNLLPKYCCKTDTYEIFVDLICSIFNSLNLVLLDSDINESELNNLGINQSDLSTEYKLIPFEFDDMDHLLEAISRNSKWKLTLFTSGTTGIPKQVCHDLFTLTRLVKCSEKHRKDIWGFAYNPTHIAGIQVFFQALLNKNTIIELFGMDKRIIMNQIEKYKITNISATPTFYRLLMPFIDCHYLVRKITSGGEKFDLKLNENLLKMFPNAKFRNIYASTEAGSLFESNNDIFAIKDSHLYKIENNQLYIHKSLLGKTMNNDEWFNTGDIVESIENQPNNFRFVCRNNEMINVGGYKVNPEEVEATLCENPKVNQAYVYSKPSPICGSILLADVVLNSECSEFELREYLSFRLQPFKIPRIFNRLDKIDTTRSGKLKRN